MKTITLEVAEPLGGLQLKNLLKELDSSGVFGNARLRSRSQVASVGEYLVITVGDFAVLETDTELAAMHLRDETVRRCAAQVEATVLSVDID